MLKAGYPQAVHSRALDRALPGNKFLKLDPVAVACLVQRQQAATDRCNHFGLAPDHPPPGVGRWKRLKRQLLAQGAYHPGWPEGLIFEQLDLRFLITATIPPIRFGFGGSTRLTRCDEASAGTGTKPAPSRCALGALGDRTVDKRSDYPSSSSRGGNPSAVELAGAVLRARQSRFEIFDHDLLGEPGWDILLVLFVAKANAVAVRAKSVAPFTRSSPETTDRWLSLLVERNLVEKKRVRSEDRYSLSVLGEAKMRRLLERWLAQLAVASSPAIRAANQNERS